MSSTSEAPRYPFSGYTAVLNAARNTASILTRTGPTPGVTVRLADAYRTSYAQAVAAAARDNGALAGPIDTHGIEAELARLADVSAADVTAALDTAEAGAGAEVPLLRAQLAAGALAVARQPGDQPRGWAALEETVQGIDAILGGARAPIRPQARMASTQLPPTRAHVAASSSPRTGPAARTPERIVADVVAGRLSPDQASQQMAAAVTADITGRPAAVAEDAALEDEWKLIQAHLGISEQGAA